MKVFNWNTWPDWFGYLMAWTLLASIVALTVAAGYVGAYLWAHLQWAP